MRVLEGFEKAQQAKEGSAVKRLELRHNFRYKASLARGSYSQDGKSDLKTSSRASEQPDYRSMENNAQK